MKNTYKVLSILGLFLLGYYNPSLAQTTTFTYTGAAQTYTVPLGVYSISMDVQGAQGGGAGPVSSLGTPTRGKGGRVQATLAVSPGQILYVFVGGCGADGTATGATGGFNGGGNSTGTGIYSGGSGGGGTDIRMGGTALTNRVVVAGGGGGSGHNGVDLCGGLGGNLTAGNGCTTGLGTAATGGNQVTGGSPGTYTGYTPGSSGALGVGGSTSTVSPGIGGGGGGGYYGGGGGCWCGGGGGSSFTATGIVTGVTLTQGYNTSCGTAIFYPNCVPPVGGSILVPSNVCPGTSMTLTDPTGSVGGTWSSASTAIATVGSLTGIVTGVSTGTTIITYKAVYSCGTAYTTAVITVQATPGPITGVVNLCQGTSETGSDTTLGGIWSSSDPGVAPVNPGTGLVIGITAGTSIITYTVGTGCFSIDTLLVTALPVPITGPTSVCMGYSVALTEGSSGGTWTFSNSFATVGSTSGIVTPVSPGVDTVDYSNGCGADALYTVTVNPLPAVITGNPYACVGYTTTFYDSVAGGDWSSFATAVAVINPSTGLITGMSGGLDVISYTLPTGCYVTTTLIITPGVSAITGSGAVCQGSSIPLSVTTVGGIWSSSNTSLGTVGSTGLVAGVSMGVIQISYTVGTGCASIHTVTVDPIAPIVGRDSVCLGSTGYLTDIVGGGTWTSTAGTVATISVDSGLVTGLITGTSRISYVLPTGCWETTTVTIIALPPAILGTKHLCPGQTVSLVDGDYWGTWSSGNTSIATVNSSGVVSGINADTVTIYYTIPPGCKVSAQVIVNPLPDPITGNFKPVCPGVQDTVFDATPGGVWSSLTPTLATVDSIGIISTVNGGMASIEYTLPTGCSITHTVSVYPAPGPTITYYWYDQTFYTDSGFVSYQWYDSIQGLIPGANSPSLAALYNEYYYVVVTDSNGCKGTSPLYHFNSIHLGITNTELTQVNIYPNPTTGIIYIQTKYNVRAVITGIDGRMEMEQANAKEMDISSLADGIHFISIFDDNNHLISVQKLVKE